MFKIGLFIQFFFFTTIICSQNPIILEKEVELFWTQKTKTIQDLAHYKNVGRWNEDKWLNWGDFNLKVFKNYSSSYTSLLTDAPTKIALEWGCGGGANARWLCATFKKVFLVDISKDALDEAEHQLKFYGFSNFEKIHIKDASNPEEIFEIQKDLSVDFVLSTAVFQHFPSKKYSERVLSVISHLLVSGGYGLIQTRFDDGSTELMSKNTDYFKNVITMTSFTSKEFVSFLEGAGLRSIIFELLVPVDSYEYYFFAKKT